MFPLIYSNFTHLPKNPSPDTLAAFNETKWYNSTVFDPIFGFSRDQPPPIFYRLPGVNNSVISHYSQSRYAQWVLLPTDHNHSNQVDYNFCRLTISLRGGCSSEMSMSMSSSKLSTNCAQHDVSFNQTLAPSPDLAWAWSNVSFQWAQAVSLDASYSDANSATPFMLSEFVPDSPVLPTKRPSLVESLAVLAANTLLDSMVDAPYNGSWPSTNTTLPSAIMQPFTARVTWNQYASPGAREPWQNIFMIILAAVFVINLICFSYLLYITLFRACFSCFRPGAGAASNRNRNGMREDYTDLNTLFQVALNSPSPRLMGNSPVRGKKESVYSKKWHLREGGLQGGQGLEGADGLCVAFDGEEEVVVAVAGQGSGKGMYLTPPSSEFFSATVSPQAPRDHPRATRKGFTPLGFEDPSYT